MTLTVPPGALNQDTQISIKLVPTDAGMVYEFQPSGLVFNQAAVALFLVDLNQQSTSVDENGTPL